MVKRVRIKLTKNGCAEIRCSGEAQELVAERAAAALDRLGNDYAMQLGVYGGAHRRAYAKILPITSEAAEENAANNTMLKALK